MNLTDRIKIGWAAFKQMGSINLPVGGRSSDETVQGMISSYLSSFSSVSPVIDFQMLKTLKHFWLYNPDFSQYVQNIVNLGNPGHSLSVDARTDAAAESAVNRLNESASRIYTIGCGVDGLIDQYLTSVAWSGAISSEDVVNLAAGRVEKVVLVPVEKIRFKYDKDRDTYDAYQQSNNLSRPNAMGLIALNPETYKYLALSTVENSPYAKPPATAAVEPILTGQEPIMQNLRYIAQKYGVMGMVAVSVTAPRRNPGETESEYQTRATAYLASVNTALDGNLNKGLAVTFKDQEVKHTSVTSGADGVYDINRMSEEQVFSGMAAQPGFHGRTDSTTETFADVVYYLLTAQTAKMQRIVKRRQEQTYRLDLRLGGLEVDGVSMSFDKAHSRNAKAEAETDEIVLRTVLIKVKNGVITPDAGAQELGYDSWADVEMVTGESDMPPKSLSAGFAHDTTQRGRKTLRLSFDKQKQRYVYQPERIELWSGSEASEGADNVFSLIKKKAQLRASN